MTRVGQRGAEYRVWAAVGAALVAMSIGGRVHADGFSDWARTAAITFPGYDRDEPLTDFPVLVVLGTNIPGFAYADFASPEDGADLRFTAGDRVTELAYEIDTWNPEGSSYVWVRLPVLSRVTTIRAYWGGPKDVVAPGHSTRDSSVWRNGYAAVWHMNESNVRDSAGHGHDGVGYGTAPVSGRVGAAQSFDGSGYIEIAKPDDIELGAGDFTISAWVRASRNGLGILGKGSAEGSVSVYEKQLVISRGSLFNAPSGAIGYAGWSCSSFVSRREIADGGWHHVGVSYSWAPGTNGIQRIYIDGDDTTMRTEFRPGADNPGNRLRIGWSTVVQGYVGADHFVGDIDEMRISQVARSANWAWACWKNQSSPNEFVSYGPVVPPPKNPLIVRGLPAREVSAGGTVLQGKVVRAAADSAQVDVFWGPTDHGSNAGAWAASADLGRHSAGALLSHPVVELEPDQVVYYRFRIAENDTEAWSWPAQRLTTGLTPEVAPSELRTQALEPAQGEPMTIQLQWENRSRTATGVVIERGASADGPWDRLATISPAMAVYADETVSSSATRHYRVGAVNGAGPPVFSDVVASSHPHATPAFAAWGEHGTVACDWYTDEAPCGWWPALVPIGTSILGFRYSDLTSPADGADLRFTAADGMDWLHHEIESWDTNGTSYAWVLIPFLSSNTSLAVHWRGPKGAVRAERNEEIERIWRYGLPRLVFAQARRPDAKGDDYLLRQLAWVVKEWSREPEAAIAFDLMVRHASGESIDEKLAYLVEWGGANTAYRCCLSYYAAHHAYQRSLYAKAEALLDAVPDRCGDFDDLGGLLRAQIHLKRHQHGAAIAGLAHFEEDHPDSILVPKARLLAAWAHLAQGQAGPAKMQLKDVAERFADTDYGEEAARILGDL